MIKKIIILTFFIFIIGCTSNEINTESTINWQDIELKDINSQETFTIGEFKKPVLIESFAVWCPTCTEQQKEMKKLHELREDVVSISLDTDPNEDAEKE